MFYLPKIAVILSIIGAVFVVKQRWTGYAVWVASNFLWIHYSFQAAAWEQALQFVILTGLSTWGLIEWRRK